MHDHSLRSDRSVIKVLVVDDHPLFREGIAALLSDQQDMKLVGQAANGREGIEQFRALTPDITLMDLQMPEMGGIDAMMTMLAAAPKARVIVLTTYSGDVHAIRALKAGASASLLKSLLHRELLATIRSVHAGAKTVSPSVASDIAGHSGEDLLSEREIEVLRLIAGGHANKEIAARLSITEETVKGRVKQIFAKLRANDRTHAAIIALRRGIIDL